MTFTSDHSMRRRRFVQICGSAAAVACAPAAAAEPPAVSGGDATSGKDYDVIVLGLGAMGSACLYHLAKGGARVLGIEQHDLAHALGSSGGLSRQTKVLPYLGGRSEPIIRRANENWIQLEKDAGQQVFHRCGYLRISNNQKLPDHPAAKSLDLLDAQALASRFPQFEKLPDGTNAILDPEGGLLRPELAIASHCHVALRRGAHIRAQEPVTDWRSDDAGVSVTTSRGHYRARHLVIAAGAWNGKLIPAFKDKLQVTRLTLGWFEPQQAEHFDIASFPIWEHGSYYGFPILPDYPGFKVAKHWRGDPADPETLDRRPGANDEKLVRSYLEKHLPSANGSITAFKVCMYVHGGPWLGLLPGQTRVSFIAACNGGGFKFSSAYGEALAELATEGRTSLPIDFMSPTA